MAAYDRHIFLCTHENCNDAQTNRALWARLKERCREPALSRVERTQARCLRVCEGGGVAVVYPEGVWYHHLDAAGIDRVVDEHLVGGRAVEELVLRRREGQA